MLRYSADFDFCVGNFTDFCPFLPSFMIHTLLFLYFESLTLVREFTFFLTFILKKLFKNNFFKFHGKLQKFHGNSTRISTGIFEKTTKIAKKKFGLEFLR